LWARPIRLGGVQVERDFLLRPDLITAPLPALSGSDEVVLQPTG
jgi:outer membrane usher protein